MIDILSESRLLLEKAGYQFGSTFADATNVFTFEDATLFGFVAVYKDADEMLEQWEHMQDLFLRRHVNGLLAHPDKGWNAYAVFLCAEQPVDRRRIQMVEENFRAARKIVGVGIKDLNTLRKAMYPLLPLSNLTSSEEGAPRAALIARLDFLSPTEKDVLMSAESFTSYLRSQALQQ
jgi:hypothetical protein